MALAVPLSRFTPRVGGAFFVRHHCAMRALLIFFALTVCDSLHAASPEYFSSRKWVEQLCSTNQTPKDERLFLGRVVPQKYGAIISYHRGITLREIIDQTPFKGTTVHACVLRPHVDAATNIILVKPTDLPKFEIKPLDMIWLYDDGPVIW